MDGERCDSFVFSVMGELNGKVWDRQRENISCAFGVYEAATDRDFILVSRHLKL